VDSRYSETLTLYIFLNPFYFVQTFGHFLIFGDTGDRQYLAEEKSLIFPS